MENGLKCSHCQSENIRIERCRCGIPCIVECNDCGKASHGLIPHVRQTK
jgi:hypothetical protein